MTNKSVAHSTVMNDVDTTDGGVVHTQSEPSSSIWQITWEQAEYILSYEPDGTFLVWKAEFQEPVSYLSSSSINTHVISYV